MNKTIALLFSLILCFAVSTIVCAQDGHRVALFQIGAGAGFPSYPGATEAMLSYADAQPGVDRVKVAVDLALGIAVSQQTYLMARIDAIGDRIAYNSQYMQMNLLLYCLGLRYYPSTTGFYLEGDAGASKAVVQISSMGDSASDFGFGYGAAIGYDFKTRPAGFGLSLEAKYNALTIEKEQAGGLMLSLNLCWM